MVPKRHGLIPIKSLVDDRTKETKVFVAHDEPGYAERAEALDGVAVLVQYVVDGRWIGESARCEAGVETDIRQVGLSDLGQIVDLFVRVRALMKEPTESEIRTVDGIVSAVATGQRRD